MGTALYFPYVRLPQTAWFTQVLLYWDRAAAIVPFYSWNEDPYMAALIREQLLEYVLPDDLAMTVSHDAFTQGFLDVLGPRRPPPEHPLAVKRIHVNKLPFQLLSELQQRGLARFADGPEHESWWNVEKFTADAYMAYLAAAISGARPGTFPVTDQREAIATLASGAGDFGQRAVRKGFARRRARRLDLRVQRRAIGVVHDGLPWFPTTATSHV